VYDSVTRRQALTLAGAGLAAPLVARTPVRGAHPASSLATLAGRSGRRFGSAIAWSPSNADAGSFANPRYERIVRDECNLLVPENELKWQASRPAPGQFDFRRFDAIAAYAQARGFALRGHTLFWVPTKWYPKWLAELDFGPKPGDAAARMLTDHVQTVCRRYRRQIVSYDVVNEAVDPATGRIRDTNVTRAIGGEAMLDLMFRTARREAPHAQLAYNDYMSWERTADDERHMAGVLRLLEGFRKRGTPVDALGVQSHIRLLDRSPVSRIVAESTAPWRRFLDEVVAMGYRLLITEFDVNDHAAPDNTVVRDRMVADYAGAYLDQMLDYSQLGDLLCWGMSDRYSWLTDFDPRVDHSIKRGTPYDAQFRQKPLRAAIARSFAGAKHAI